MPKKNSDYLKMLELGEWLEEVFNPELKWWQYDGIFKNAKRVLNVDTDESIEESIREYGNLTVRILEQIAENRLENYYLELWDLEYLDDEEYGIPDKTFWSVAEVVLSAGKDKLKLALFVQEKLIKHQLFGLANKVNDNQQDFSESISLINRCIAFLEFRLYALSWLKETVDSSTPLNIRFKNLKFHIGYLEYYNGLQHWLEYDEHKGFVRSFSHTQEFVAGDILYAQVQVLFCRIFIDFLILGGLDYYGFCKNCEKFFLVQRRGRKKFCSDSCRVEHFREQHTT